MTLIAIQVHLQADRHTHSSQIMTVKLVQFILMMNSYVLNYQTMGDGGGTLVSAEGETPSRMVGVSASVNLLKLFYYSILRIMLELIYARATPALGTALYRTD